MSRTSPTFAPARATRIRLLSFSTPQMRAFHLAWIAFFVCFFAWFACAPLMPVIRGELDLTNAQIANINIAAVLVTILVRLVVGPLCDRFGPRRTYTGLLLLGAIPVLGVATAQSYESFIFFRLAIGAIGASFVITQYHTSVMFAPNVVGTANATTAGWGNAGGGATQSLMPLLLAAILYLGVDEAFGWRVALLVPGVMMIVTAFFYWRLTQDSPAGDFRTLRATGLLGGGRSGWRSFTGACGNYRVWLLFVTYAACFGVELFIHNVAALYYIDRFGLSLQAAGLAAGTFGLLALFARALGGIASDRLARARGLDGRTLLLFALMAGEGVGLLWFSQTQTAVAALATMLGFGLCVHMACGATYALVPFVDRKALGGVAGIVGAGGNAGAVAAGFLMKASPSPASCFFILGCLVCLASLCALAVRFSPEHKRSEEQLYREALASRGAGEAGAGA